MLGSSRSSVPGHRIGTGATFEGTLRFSGRLEVEGVVVGAVIADPAEGSEVIVGPKGSVRGRIEAATIVISGAVEGPVSCSVRLDVLSGARLDGDITYRDLQIQHGAVVEGSLKPIDGEQVALKLVANSRI
jgi:cytoskeletal protein CcmA (bactofilin family)